MILLFEFDKFEFFNLGFIFYFFFFLDMGNDNDVIYDIIVK